MDIKKKKKNRMFQDKLDHRQISQYILSGLQLKEKTWPTESTD